MLDASTEAMIGIIELRCRLARSYRNRDNYRRRMLLAADGITPWPPLDVRRAGNLVLLRESHGSRLHMIDFGGLADPPGVPASRYVVVIDRPINLGVGGDIDQTFTFHAPRVVDTGSVIVSFLVVRADPVVLEVTLNDLGYTRDYNPGPERTVHEVLGPALRPVGNVLTLRVQSGSCRISDLIIWYQSTRF